MNATCLNSSDCSAALPMADYGAVIICTTVLLALAATLIIVLNPLCLVVLYRARGIQETTKMFMALLTVSDFCIGLVSAFPTLSVYISGKWVLGEFLCTILGIVSPACYIISTFSLLLLTVDRYVAIIHSLRYPSLVTLHRTKVIVALLWSIALILCVLLFGILTRAVINTETQQCDYAMYPVFKYFTVCG